MKALLYVSVIWLVMGILIGMIGTLWLMKWY